MVTDIQMGFKVRVEEVVLKKIQSFKIIRLHEYTPIACLRNISMLIL